MALAVRAGVVGGTTTGSSTTVALTIPTSGVGGTVVAGDVGICCFETAGANTVTGAPSGWTQQKITTNAQSNITGCIYTKTLTAGDINTPLTWTVSGSVFITGSIDVISGANEAAFTYTAWAVGAGTTAANPTATIPVGGWDFGFWMGGITTAGAPFTCTKPASYTGLSTRATAVASGLNHAQATGFLSVPAGGSTAGSTCTFSVSTARNAAYTIGVASSDVVVAGATSALALASPAGAVIVPAWVAGAKGNDGQATNVAAVTMTVPGGAAAGQIAVAAVCPNVNTVTLTGTPTGWTQVSGPDSSHDMVTWLFTKTLTAADVGQPFTWTVSAACRLIGVMDVFSTEGAVGTPTWKSITTSTSAPVDATVTASSGSLVYVVWMAHSASSTADVLTLPSSPKYTADTTVVTAGTTTTTLQSGHYGPVAAGTVGGGTGASAPAAGTSTFYALEVVPGATIAGVTATLAAVAPVGTPTVTTTLAGAVTAVTAAAPAGEVTLSASRTGLTTDLTVTAPAGVTSADTNITGVTAVGLLAAPAGTVAATSVLAGAAGAATFAAPASTSAVTIPGVTTNLVVASPAGTVTAGPTGAATSVALAAPAGACTATAALAGATTNEGVAAPAGTITAGVVAVGAGTVALTAPAGTATASTGQTGQATGLSVFAPAGAVHAIAQLPAAVADLQLTAADPVTSADVTRAGLVCVLILSAPAGTTVPARDITVTAGAPTAAWATGPPTVTDTAGPATTRAITHGQATTAWTDNPGRDGWTTGDPR